MKSHDTDKKDNPNLTIIRESKLTTPRRAAAMILAAHELSEVSPEDAEKLGGSYVVTEMPLQEGDDPHTQARVQIGFEGDYDKEEIGTGPLFQKTNELLEHTPEQSQVPQLPAKNPIHL